ncbi:FAD-dependent monooxygenase [Dactylosporangium sp. CA-233914]|uniref:FAD-dependent monooxygenase n=1 Tax=Dactylosporangium sp. CA-233914 TaxID=3239934 RepID=UPI003D90A023
MTGPLPVLVVGGGPAGLAAAIELGLRGVECLLVEPRAAVSHTRPRGKTTHARTMEHFRRWGIADELRAVTPTPPEVYHDVAFCTSLFGHEVHRMPNALGIFAQKRAEMAETGLFIGQPYVEEALRRKVASLASVRTRYGARATGRLVEQPEQVGVEIVNPDGRAELLHARYVLAADGPRSTLREALGIPLLGGAEGGESVSALFRAPGLWGQVRHAPAVFYWCVGEGRAGNLSPYDTSRDLWVASWQRSAGIDPIAAIQALIGRPSELEVLNVDTWQSRRAIAERYRAGRVFLVGDAARQTPPWGGHGYNTCVLDAVDLAWKLAAVVQGWATERLLDTYEVERCPVAQYVIETSTRNLRVLSSDLVRAGTDDDGPTGRTARAQLAAEIDAAKRTEFYSLGLVLGYNYAHSPAVCGRRSGQEGGQPADVTTYTPSFKAGARLPHAWLTEGRSLFDLLGQGFTLLVNEYDDTAAAIARAAGRVPLTVLTAKELPGSYRRPAYVVVRPDQHVTWSGDRLDAPPAAIWNAALGHDLT